DKLLDTDVRLRYGKLPNNGGDLDALVLFAPHPTGNPDDWAKARPRFMKRLTDAAKADRVTFNANTKHLGRSIGSCVFCTMLEIGPCDYEKELKPLTLDPMLHAAHAAAPDKPVQMQMLASFVNDLKPQREVWDEVEGVVEV